jgi:uncharacterized protein VirK/YbjX
MFNHSNLAFFTDFAQAMKTRATVAVASAQTMTKENKMKKESKWAEDYDKFKKQYESEGSNEK